MAAPRNHPAPRQRILDYLNIHPSELRPALGLSLYLLLGIASVICLKAAADSLFLTQFDATRLPYVDLAITALVGLVVGLYLRLSNRVSQGRLILWTQVFLILNLLTLWYLLGQGVFGIPALLYVWVGIFTVLIPSQVWSLAGSIFDTRQAKRLFSLVGAGGILGAALGGQFASRVGPRIGTENLLLATLGFVVASSLIVSALIGERRKPLVRASGGSSGNASFAASFRLIRSTRYLSLVAAGLFFSTVVGTLVKYQFKAVVQVHFADAPQQMTVFFGDFYGYIAVFSFLFHMLFTGRLLRWVGLGLSLFILPVSLLGGAAALVLSSSLGAAVFARGCDQSFRHSVDRSSIELLYVPLTANVRAQVKSFLDMIVSRSADGLASVILVLLLSVLGLELQQVGLVSVLFTLPWLLLVWQLRGEYRANLRHSIGRKDINAEALLNRMAESAQPGRLEETLRGSDPRAIETAVDWMQFSGVTAGQAQLASLLTHELSAIRRKAMAAVLANEMPGCENEVLRFLELECNVDSRWQALDYLERQDMAKSREALTTLLDSEDRGLAATAAARLLQHSGPERKAAEEVFSGYIQESAEIDSGTRETAARLLSFAPDSNGSARDLARFLGDPDVGVVRAALKSAAVLKPWDETPRLLGMLADHRFRREARAALAAFDESILDTLIRAIEDPGIDFAARRRIPRIVSTIGGRRSAKLLLGQLPRLDRVIGFQVVRALSRIRKAEPRLHFSHETVSAILGEELRHYYQEVTLLEAVPADSAQPGVGFLRRAMRERLDHRLDWVFHLLGLIYPQKEILDARYWIASGRPELRSNSVEFLDSRLINPFRQMFLPLLEDLSAQRLIETGRNLFALRPVTYPTVLWQLLGTADPWMQACACYVAAESKMEGLRVRIERLTADPDPLLAETARTASARLQAARGPS